MLLCASPWNVTTTPKVHHPQARVLPSSFRFGRTRPKVGRHRRRLSRRRPTCDMRPKPAPTCRTSVWCWPIPGRVRRYCRGHRMPAPLGDDCGANARRRKEQWARSREEGTARELAGTASQSSELDKHPCRRQPLLRRNRSLKPRALVQAGRSADLDIRHRLAAPGPSSGPRRFRATPPPRCSAVQRCPARPCVRGAATPGGLGRPPRAPRRPGGGRVWIEGEGPTNRAPRTQPSAWPTLLGLLCESPPH